MAVTAIVKKKQYSYETVIEEINGETIKNSRKIFENFRERGIIQSAAFDDLIWTITNEAVKCSINFRIDEVEFERYCHKRFGCTQAQYAVAMRVLITTLFGSDIRTLQKTAVSLRKLLAVVAGKSEIETLQDNAETMIDFLDLLPGETLYRDEMRDALSDMAEYAQVSQTAGNKPRKLSTYQSYFRFFEQLNHFWTEACAEDKLFFFPVYLWWNLTSILPMRPSEFVLIPRDCITRGAGKARLTIRRTKLKGQRLKAEYFIDKDYELCSYEVPDSLADAIEGYILGTAAYDCSDIGTLLCCQYQYQYLNLVKSNNSSHYTYSNLRDCLRYFYSRILRDKKGFRVRDKETGISHHELADDEIEWITLGDTRHLSMINLIVSGGSPLICKELARHDDINISANYYANIKNFVEVLSFSRYEKHIPNYAVSNLPSVIATQDMPILSGDGHCASENAKSGNYSDCLTAISLGGELLHCESCKYYVLPKNRTRIDWKSMTQAVDDRERDMHESFNFLLYAVERVRKGLGYQESLQSSLLRYQASALQYGNALFRRYETEEL